MHLIPAGLVGDIYIAYGQPSGLPPEREGKAIVFRIPPEGILVTQDTPSAAWHHSTYFYVGANGARQPLEFEPSSVHDTPESRSNNAPFVWFSRSGTMAGGGLDCSISFVQYYVGTQPLLLQHDPRIEEAHFRAFVSAHHLCSPGGA